MENKLISPRSIYEQFEVFGFFVTRLDGDNVLLGHEISPSTIEIYYDEDDEEQVYEVMNWDRDGVRVCETVEEIIEVLKEFSQEFGW
jgi:hypothetical protein